MLLGAKPLYGCFAWWLAGASLGWYLLCLSFKQVEHLQNKCLVWGKALWNCTSGRTWVMLLS